MGSIRNRKTSQKITQNRKTAINFDQNRKPHCTSSHPPGVKNDFIKGEALRLLRTNSSETAFNENITNFISRLTARGYPYIYKMIQTTLSEVRFAGRQSAKKKKNESKSCPLSQHTTHRCGTLKNILMLNWDKIQNQPGFAEHHLQESTHFIVQKRRKSLTDMLVKAKI